MSNRMKITTVTVLLLFLSIPTTIYAQIRVKTEYFGTSSYRKSEGETDEKVGNSKGSAIVYQAGVNIPLSMKMDENNRPTMWSIGVGGAYADLTNKNFTEDLVVDEIMNIGLSVNHLRPISNKWSLLLSVGGGIYTSDTSLSKIRYKNLLANVAGIFICHIRPNLQLGGGIALNNSFGYPMVFPAFYFNWATDGKYNVKISMMDGLEISAGYKANTYIDLNIVVEMNGQMALVEKDGKDKIFSHQYIVTGFRPEIMVGKKLSIPITAGIHAMRTAEYSDRSLKGMFDDKSYYFQVSPYVSAGLAINF